MSHRYTTEPIEPDLDEVEKLEDLVAAAVGYLMGQDRTVMEKIYSAEPDLFDAVHRLVAKRNAQPKRFANLKAAPKVFTPCSGCTEHSRKECEQHDGCQYPEGQE